MPAMGNFAVARYATRLEGLLSSTRTRRGDTGNLEPIARYYVKEVATYLIDFTIQRYS